MTAPDSPSPHLLETGNLSSNYQLLPPSSKTLPFRAQPRFRLSSFFNTRHGILFLIISLPSLLSTVASPLLKANRIEAPCLCGHAAILLTFQGPLQTFSRNLLTNDT
ncbi:hypothetical protein HZ326_18515 [Fusarium oxysporum f. sp. albedinis]|nr:hypothetical protein HZ326_18515 [Fusarium oxysporum f. sp. albedinis]